MASGTLKVLNLPTVPSKLTKLDVTKNFNTIETTMNINNDWNKEYLEVELYSSQVTAKATLYLNVRDMELFLAQLKYDDNDVYSADDVVKLFKAGIPPETEIQASSIPSLQSEYLVKIKFSSGRDWAGRRAYDWSKYKPMSLERTFALDLNLEAYDRHITSISEDTDYYAGIFETVENLPGKKYQNIHQLMILFMMNFKKQQDIQNNLKL